MITVALISANETIIAATAVALSHTATPYALTTQRTLHPADTAAPIILLDGLAYPPTDPDPDLITWLAALPSESVLIWLLPSADVPELPPTAVGQQHTLTTDLLDADHLLPLLSTLSPPPLPPLCQALFTSLPYSALLWQQREEGTFTLVQANPIAHAAGNNRLESFIGVTADVFFETDPTITEQMHLAFTTGEPQQRHQPYTLHTTGEEGWFVSHYIKLDEQYLLNLVHDVTQSRQTAMALANSEAHLRSVWKYVSDALALSDKHGRVIDANNAYLELYGYERHEVIDQNFAIIFPPEMREQANRAYQAVFHAPTQPEMLESEIRRADGSIRIVETRVTFITNDAGKRLAMLSSIRDVTARKQAEIALREREALLSSILHAVPGILGVINIPQQQIRFINQRPDIFDMGDVALDIAALSEILLPENLQAVLTYFEQLEYVGEQAVRTITLRAKNAAGGYQYLQGWHTPLTVDDHGRVQELVFIVMDVTAQEEIQQQLQRTQRRQQAMLEALPDMMFRLNREGRVIDFHAADMQELIVPPAEVMGTNIQDIMSPQVAQMILEQMHITLETGQLTQIEYPLMVQKGIEEYEARLVQSGPEEVVAVVRNISEKKRARSERQRQIMQLQEARARLVHSEKLAAIGELVAGVAHELNNPVTTLVLNAELLQRFQGSLANPKLNSLLNTITQQALRSGSIVRGLLDFARQRPPERLATQFNDLLTATLNLMAYELRTHRFTINTVLDPDLPEVIVDGQQIQQVLVNLLNNAMQAMPPDQEDKQIWLKSYHDKEHGRVCFSMRDNGPGISLEVQKRIFEPFFTTKAVGEGTGLGLSLCRRIINEHQGRMWFDSTPHTGTTFFVAIPQASSASLEANGLFPPLKQAKQKSLSKKTGRILVVDDESSILEACRFVLGTYYEVDTASSGSQALDYIAHVRYDLLISDIFMPEMGGIDLYRYLREHPEHQPYRLLFMTGGVLDTYTQAFSEQLDVPLLHKPFTVNELHTAVADVLQES